MPELVLRVPSAASDDAVRSARHRVQRHFHPDRPTGDTGASRLANAAAAITPEHRGGAVEGWKMFMFRHCRWRAKCTGWAPVAVASADVTEGTSWTSSWFLLVPAGPAGITI